MRNKIIKATEDNKRSYGGISFFSFLITTTLGNFLNFVVLHYCGIKYCEGVFRLYSIGNLDNFKMTRVTVANTPPVLTMLTSGILLLRTSYRSGVEYDCNFLSAFVQNVQEQVTKTAPHLCCRFILGTQESGLYVKSNHTLMTKDLYVPPEAAIVIMESISLCDPSSVEPGGNEGIGYEDWG